MEDPIVPTPGCRYAVIGACRNGRCLVGLLWTVYDRCAQEKRTEGTRRYVESGEYEGEYEKD